MKISIGAILAVSLAVSNAYASLINRSSGLIYDTELNITWMSDASLSVTNTFGTAGTINLTGTMNWQTARDWITAMNTQSYLGFSNWRLPSTLYPDPTCAAVSGGHNCVGSEMGHLFYEELGGVADQDIATTHNSNYFLFQNIQNNRYWSGTGFTQSPNTPDDNAWTFYFPGGVQQTLAVENFTAVWAVRDGDVHLIGEPGTYTLTLGSLALLMFSGNRRLQLNRRH